MKKSTILYSGITLSVIILTVWWIRIETPDTPNQSIQQNPINTENRSVQEFFSVQTETKSTSIAVDGRLKAKNRLEIFPEVQGTLLRGAKPFREGGEYRQGELLVQIDRTEAALQLQAARSGFHALAATLLPDIGLDYPQHLHRYEEWFNKINAEQNLPELPSFQPPQMNRFLASRGLYERYYQIKSSEERLEKYTIRAPFAGQLSAVHVEPGQSVGPQNHLGTFVSGREFTLTASIRQNQANYFSKGMAIELTNSNQTETWNSVVSEINPSVHPGTQMVELYLDVTGNGLREGMYLQGSISGGTEQALALIPKSALQRTGHVLVLQDGALRETPVEIAGLQRELVWVRGLSDGDQIVQQANRAMSGLVIQ